MQNKPQLCFWSCSRKKLHEHVKSDQSHKLLLQTDQMPFGEDWQLIYIYYIMCKYQRQVLRAILQVNCYKAVGGCRKDEWWWASATDLWMATCRQLCLSMCTNQQQEYGQKYRFSISDSGGESPGPALQQALSDCVACTDGGGVKCWQGQVWSCQMTATRHKH